MEHGQTISPDWELFCKGALELFYNGITKTMGILLTVNNILAVFYDESVLALQTIIAVFFNCITTKRQAEKWCLLAMLYCRSAGLV